MESTLKGQVAVVCGASGNVGSAIARRLAENGAAVAIHYLSSREKAVRLSEDIVHAGGKADVFRADLTDESSVEELFRHVKQRMSGIHILVNAVHGPSDPKTVAEMVWEDWKVHLGALKVHFLLCRAVIPYLRENHFGRIVFISGGLSRRYYSGCSAYSTIKAGLNAFCKTLGLEEGPHGITVNIVAPGRVVVEETESPPDQSWKKMDSQWVSHAPLGRDARTQDIAAAVLYFVSPQAECVTGQTLFVAGGEIMP